MFPMSLSGSSLHIDDRRFWRPVLNSQREGIADRISGAHLVVFDEIDHLEDANALLCELLRASGQPRHGVMIFVLRISTDDTVRQTVSPTVTDTLIEADICFSPYDAAALRTMLELRVDRAVVDKACDTSAIAKAALAAQEVGNARQALNLRRVGGELAEQHGEVPVTDDHIETARERVQRGRVAKVTRDQTEHVSCTLEAI